MALTGVLRPGHAQIKVLDLEESIGFYSNVLGLIQTGRQDDRAYFKAWDERDHHSVILRGAGEAGIDFLGWKVADAATLDQLEKDLNNYAIHTERIAAGDLLETGERVRFTLPSGHVMELYAHKTEIGNGLGYVNPYAWNEAAERGIAPIRMDHTLLYGPDIEKNEKIFTEVLGFHVTERIMLSDGETMLGSFMSCSMKGHDIAFIRNEEPGKLHHVSFLIDSWEKVLRAADLMTYHNVSIDLGPTRHGVTRGLTVYAFDNSGNRFETFSGGAYSYPDWKPLTWTWEEVGRAVFYHQRSLNEAFLNVYT